MRSRYTSIRVNEETRRLARELSARAGMPIKDFVKIILEFSAENDEIFRKGKNKARRIGFDFGW